MKRKHIPLKVKLAAALLQLGDVPFSQAQRMTAEEIIRLYHFDHYPIPHSHGGPDEPWNLQPMLAGFHKEKTAEKDLPQLAKTKRISKAHEEFRQRLLVPPPERETTKSRWPSRPFPKRRHHD
jgi:hypothetical protein